MKAGYITGYITGYRKIMGTDWGIENYVDKRGPREWAYVRGLCNGVPDSTKIFRTKKAAVAALTADRSGKVLSYSSGEDGKTGWTVFYPDGGHAVVFGGSCHGAYPTGQELGTYATREEALLLNPDCVEDNSAIFATEKGIR